MSTHVTPFHGCRSSHSGVLSFEFGETGGSLLLALPDALLQGLQPFSLCTCCKLLTRFVLTLL